MSSTTDRTQQVLTHHLQAFDSGDGDAILDDYAPDAVLLTPEGPKQGHHQIRPVLEWLLANIFTADCDFRMIQQLVEGEIAYIAWAAETSQYRVPLATDTYLVRDDKIVVQTFTARVENKQS